MSDLRVNHAGVTRRVLLSFMGAGAVGLVGAGAATAHDRGPRPPRRDDRPQGDGDDRPPRRDERQADAATFLGSHQPGIVTPAQTNLAFASFDVTGQSRDVLVALLRSWSQIADSQMSANRAQGLTVTIGFGASLFITSGGQDRFGLAGARPGRFTDLPSFPGDRVESAISGGDLCVQVCANGAQTVAQTLRDLHRAADGSATVRWTQAGTGGSAGRGAPTPRNLFGFKDGTANIPPNDTAEHNEYVWVQSGDGPDWMVGGTYLAARKIAMHVDTWDAQPVATQERVFGRTKSEGAPLSGGSERTRPDFRATDASGARLIDRDSHMALAHSIDRQRMRILRRGYTYVDGTLPSGSPDAGLFFLAFNRDLQSQFIPMQRQLSTSDLMNQFVTYRSSSAFAIPPGVGSAGGFVGEGLFGA